MGNPAGLGERGGKSGQHTCVRSFHVGDRRGVCRIVGQYRRVRPAAGPSQRTGTAARHQVAGTLVVETVDGQFRRSVGVAVEEQPQQFLRQRGPLGLGPVIVRPYGRSIVARSRPNSRQREIDLADLLFDDASLRFGEHGGCRADGIVGLAAPVAGGDQTAVDHQAAFGGPARL